VLIFLVVDELSLGSDFGGAVARVQWWEGGGSMCNVFFGSLSSHQPYGTISGRTSIYDGPLLL